VHITGEVNEPGVFELPYGSRVEHAIQAAGGLTDDADDRSINRAAVLADGQQIIVNDSAEPISSGNGGGDLLVNINTACINELQRLHGVGEATARVIIEHRERNGPFLAVEQIMNVSGIGERTFERLRDNITVG
jgi:competence protein ComEA